MLKTIFKEGLIVILLMVIIMIMLAILFYDYIPANKVIPKQIQAYDLPQNIQQELDKIDKGLNMAMYFARLNEFQKDFRCTISRTIASSLWQQRRFYSYTY